MSKPPRLPSTADIERGYEQIADDEDMFAACARLLRQEEKMIAKMTPEQLAAYTAENETLLGCLDVADAIAAGSARVIVRKRP